MVRTRIRIALPQPSRSDEQQNEKGSNQIYPQTVIDRALQSSHMQKRKPWTFHVHACGKNSNRHSAPKKTPTAPIQKIMQKQYNRSYYLVLARAYTKTIKRKVNERAFDSKFHAINCQLMARTHPSQAFRINQISKHMKVIATKKAIRNRGASR